MFSLSPERSAVCLALLFFSRIADIISKERIKDQKDNLLTGVHCGQVEELQALNAEKQKKMEESLKSDENYVPVDKQEILTKMLEILKPGETVAKVYCISYFLVLINSHRQALRRLGGKKTMSASERLKAKKKGNIGNQVNKVRSVYYNLS